MMRRVPPFRKQMRGSPPVSPRNMTDCANGLSLGNGRREIGYQI
jgi:hypothetical protein